MDARGALPATLEALQLSVVTGPNEGYMITQRGLFGIWQWEVLPQEVKARSRRSSGEAAFRCKISLAENDAIRKAHKGPSRDSRRPASSRFFKK
jgi:hypothetical protein